MAISTGPPELLFIPLCLVAAIGGLTRQCPVRITLLAVVLAPVIGVLTLVGLFLLTYRRDWPLLVWLYSNTWSVWFLGNLVLSVWLPSGLSRVWAFRRLRSDP